MNIETERKFLVKDEGFKAQAVEKHRVRQGYIAHDGGRTVRVRLWDDIGVLTIKGPSMDGGISRYDWERELTREEAEDLFLLCKPGMVDKTRWIVPVPTVMADPDRPSRKFEVDEFHGENEGLVIAEIELGSPDEAFEKPSWLGEEVTGDRRYYNSYLALIPFKRW